MEHWPPPRYEDMLIVFRHLYEACRRNNIPIDVTPNIEVSLIVQPGDTRYLAPRDFRCESLPGRNGVGALAGASVFRLEDAAKKGDCFGNPHTTRRNRTGTRLAL